MLRNKTSPAWNRGRAGIALGKLLEEEGQTDEAVSAYLQAFEQIRSVFPMYSGVKATFGSKSRVDAPDAEECPLVRELVDSLRRLAPDSIPEPKGRIKFEVVGLNMPSSVHIGLRPRIFDPSITNPDKGLSHNLPRSLPLRQDQPVTATILDGTYRLRYRGHNLRWNNDSEQIVRRLQVDVDGWPQEITVQGDVVKLPPIRLRLAEPVELQMPADEIAVDLSDVELKWAPLPNATRYRVHLTARKETPSPKSVMFLVVDVESPRMRFIDLSDQNKEEVRDNLISGRTGAWRVDAYDAESKRIGTTLKEMRFLVAGELSRE